ncbi:tRNA wybutosine-synthesizing protein 3 homolog isoform X1 [Artibeus jamaicensis]|uniref:tRNA wybutosine-synthesizing protein 3 homolog isoform X1 n=1 Tax=Artibeus jamaicensis TaxID=9417 RepID=UPI00235B0696|nr:tRNA wybutosine-synthesizing protein 3 homolog isoform X1 [Artibeus jamaicensis]
MDRSSEFGRWKAQCLSKADLSRKGSVDEDVAEIVQLLNGQEQFFTTSSCSGRIILLDGSINGFEVQKQNCRWLLVTHKPCIKDDVIVALKNANGDAVLKFEPLVLHVQCQQLQDAQILHSVAIDSGFRNSGITVGKRGKTMLAVRSTHGLEVPLSHKGKLMVTEDYIDFLLKIANQKMEENKKRIESSFPRILFGFTTAYNMLWKDKLLLSPIPKRKSMRKLMHILIRKKETEKKHVTDVLLKKMIKNLKTMTVQASVLLSSRKMTKI